VLHMTTVEPPALSPSTSIDNSDGNSKPPPQTPRRPGRSGSGERTAGAIMSRHVVTVLKSLNPLDGVGTAPRGRLPAPRRG
jgi:hypothetical protein